MKKYKMFYWFSRKENSGFGVYPTKEMAIENKDDAVENLSDDITLEFDELTHLELIEEGAWEVLEYHHLDQNKAARV